MSMDEFLDWDPLQKVKLGSALIRLLLDHTTFAKPLRRGYAPPEHAFLYSRKRVADKRMQAFIAIHADLLDIAVNEEFTSTSSFIPPTAYSTRVQPMVIPPNEWTDVNNGGYETIKVSFMRTKSCKIQKVRW